MNSNCNMAGLSPLTGVSEGMDLGGIPIVAQPTSALIAETVLKKLVDLEGTANRIHTALFGEKLCGSKKACSNPSGLHGDLETASEGLTDLHMLLSEVARRLGA